MALSIYENFSTKGAILTSFFFTALRAFEEQSNLKEHYSVFEKFSSEIFMNSIIYQTTMASTSGSNAKPKKGSEMLIKGVEWKTPNFKLILAVAESLDPYGAQSQILSKVLLINDIRTHFKCTVQELGTMEMDNALGEMCVDRVLTPKHKHLEMEGLNHIPHLPKNFQVKWIRYILSQFHNGKLWLEQPILITKKMIHKVTGMPMLSKAKTTKTLG